MLFLHYVPNEFVEAALSYLQSVYELQDNPLNQEIVNDYFRKFNGPFETLDNRIAEIAFDLVAMTEMKYTITGIFSLIEKGDKITYNGVSLTLPKLLVCEDYGERC